jgi:hypothetical protein
MVIFLPAGRERKGHGLPRLADIRPGARILGAILVYFASIAIITNYAGKLGVQNGLSIAFLSSALAIGNLGALPRSLIAMLASGRRTRDILLLVASLAQCLAIGAMMWVQAGIVFAAAFFLIQLCITLIAPLQVAALVDQDANGRAIEGLAAMQSLGQAAGPLSVAFLITDAGVDGAYIAAMLLVAASALLVLRASAGRSRNRATL